MPLEVDLLPHRDRVFLDWSPVEQCHVLSNVATGEAVKLGPGRHQLAWDEEGFAYLATSQGDDFNDVDVDVDVDVDELFKWRLAVAVGDSRQLLFRGSEDHLATIPAQILHNGFVEIFAGPVQVFVRPCSF